MNNKEADGKVKIEYVESVKKLVNEPAHSFENVHGIIIC